MKRLRVWWWAWLTDWTWQIAYIRFPRTWLASVAGAVTWWARRRHARASRDPDS